MDSAQLLSIDFIQNTVSNFNSNISVSNSPTSIEFVDDNLNVVSYSVSNGSVNRNCFNCNISNVLNGQQSNCDPLTNYYTQELIIHHTNAPSNGNLSVNNKEFSIQPSPQTILLDSLNSDGSNQSITVLFTSDSTCQFQNTVQYVAPNSCNGNNVVVFADSIVDTCSSSFLRVPVRADNFIDLISMQGSVSWDSSLLILDSIYIPINSLGMNLSNFGTANSTNGILSFSWNDVDLSGETLVDSSILFEIGFNYIGSGTGVSGINLTNTPTVYEFVDNNFNVIPYTKKMVMLVLNAVMNSHFILKLIQIVATLIIL